MGDRRRPFHKSDNRNKRPHPISRRTRWNLLAAKDRKDSLGITNNLRDDVVGNSYDAHARTDSPFTGYIYRITAVGLSFAGIGYAIAVFVGECIGQWS